MFMWIENCKRIALGSAVVAVALMLATQSRADVLASNFAPSDAFVSAYSLGGSASGTAAAFGVSFTVTNQDYFFDDAQAVMALTSGTNAVSINLQTSNSQGLPSGTVLQTVELDNQLSTAALSVLTFNSNASLVLNALQTYWLVAYAPDADTGLIWVANVEGDSSNLAGNMVSNSLDSPTGPWTVFAAENARPTLEINGTPTTAPPPPPPSTVPEPASWLLFGTGLIGGAGLAARRWEPAKRAG